MKVEITAFSTSILFTIHEDTLTLLLRSIKQPREPSISCLVTTSYTPVACPQHVTAAQQSCNCGGHVGGAVLLYTAI